MTQNEKLKGLPSKAEMKEIENLYNSNQLDVLIVKTKELINSYPNVSVLLNILGSAFYKTRKHEEAKINFKKAIKLQPNFQFAHNNLGNALKALGQFKEAINSYKKAIEINSNYSEAYCNLGMTQLELGNVDEAVLNQKKALKINPNYADAYNNLGILYSRSGDYKVSIENFKKALKINPNYSQVYSNLGASLSELGDHDEAIKNFRKALKLNPKYTEVNFNESTIRLFRGEFEEGWKKYEYRFEKDFITKMRYEIKKIWDGNYLDGTLLVWSEQGIGDHILFLSMIPDLKKYAKTVILEIDPRLVNLFSRYCKESNLENIKIVGMQSEKLKNFDKHIAAGSLGQFLRKSLKSFKNTPKKYLVSSISKEKEIKKIFLNNNKLKIGISWKTLNLKQQFRNITLSEMIPILSNDNCEFINLQFGETKKELKSLKEDQGINIKTINGIDIFNDIESLAALINCLDLVITIQNTTAHLSGALGKKTWVMLAKNARWHWLINQTNSIWYPSLKLFRQEKIGNWNNIINNISIDLKSLTQKS